MLIIIANCQFSLVQFLRWAVSVTHDTIDAPEDSRRHDHRGGWTQIFGSTTSGQEKTGLVKKQFLLPLRILTNVFGVRVPTLLWNCLRGNIFNRFDKTLFDL